MDSFTPIWDRIAAHSGSDFRQKMGRQFTYSLVGNAIVRSVDFGPGGYPHDASPVIGPPTPAR